MKTATNIGTERRAGGHRPSQAPRSPALRSLPMDEGPGAHAEITPAARLRDLARRCGYPRRSPRSEVPAATGAVLRVGASTR